MSSKKSSGPKNIRVFFRVRPPIGREVEGKHTMQNLVLDPSEPTKVTIKKKDDKTGAPAKVFHFNKAWGPSSHNDEVYKEFGRNAVEAAFDGQHGVLFVYGQTGSGKTFTISNEDPNNLGVLQQSMKEVWTRIAEDKQHEYKVTLTYVQLYKEALTNLLEDSKDPKDKELRLQTANDGSATMVKESNGLPVDVAVASYQQTMEYFRVGLSRKETAKTEMNATSSRSHTIFCLSINKSKITGPVLSRDTVDVDSVNASFGLQGKLYLCDLAGSERASKTGVQGNMLDEAASINGSLLVLGRVVAALTDKKAQHVPFRESRLTRILQYSLTGNGNTSLVINCSPSDDNTEETLSAILFGQRAIQIKQAAKRHEVVDYKALYLQLQADLDSKNDKLIQAAVMEEIAMRETVVAGLQEQLKFAENESELLRRENTQLKAQLAALNGGKVPPPLPSASAPAGGGGGGGGGGGDDGQWSQMISTLKASVAEKQRALVAAEEDRVKLGHQLAEEKLTVFRLAEKLRAVVIKYQNERAQWTDEHNTLRAEIAQAKGSEYINVMGGMEAESPRPEAPSTPIDSAPGGDVSTVLQTQLDRAVYALRLLQEERISLVVYQNKAQQAIKLLATENVKLGGTLGR